MRKQVRCGLVALLMMPLLTMAQGKFTEVSAAVGIDHSFKVYEGMFGGGTAVVDFDNDGWEDLYITGGMNDDVLYRNNGNGTFTNVFGKSGLGVTREYVTQGVASADVNRDGFVDLFVTTITRKDRKEPIPRAINLFFLNNGNGTFRDATKEYGLDQMMSFSTGVSFGDFNADGFPDVYVGNYFNEFKGKLSVINDATIVQSNQIAKGYLLLNEGGRKFRDVYSDYGLDYRGFGFGGIFTDFDNDGDQDLFVNHDFGYKRTPDLLLENKYPWSSYKDVAPSKGLDLKINSMATAVADVNNDGYLDYFATNIGFNWFMVSQGKDKKYVNRSKEMGMMTFTISWGANFADFDNDGDEDLYVANGDLNPNCVPMPDFYYENRSGKFVEQGAAVGITDYGIGRGSVVFDYDHDGDLDVLVVNQVPVADYPVPSVTHLYRNDSPQGHWLNVRLEGVDAEKHGIGSRIEVVVGGKTMIREIDGGASSHLSQNSVIGHFGLGAAMKADKVRVLWTGGNTQEVMNVPGGQTLLVKEVPAFLHGHTTRYALMLGAALLILALIYFQFKSISSTRRR